MFGRNLPAARPPRRLDISDIELIRGLFNEENDAIILYGNALHFYKLNT